MRHPWEIVRVVAFSALAAAPALLAAQPVPFAAAPGQVLSLSGGGAKYYYANDGRRYAFVSDAAYRSWYADEASVHALPIGELSSIPSGGVVAERPGTAIVRTAFAGELYAVGRDGELRLISSAAEAERLYGPAWKGRVSDAPDSAFAAYAIGAPLAEGEIPDGTVARDDAGAFFLLGGGRKRAMSPEAAQAFAVQDRFVMPASAELLARYAEGSALAPSEAEVLARPVSAGAALSLLEEQPGGIVSGEDAALLAVRLVSPERATLRAVTVRLDARTDAPSAELDDDAGGLVHGNSARANFSALRLADDQTGTAFASSELSSDIQLDQSQTVVFEGNLELQPGVPVELLLRARVRDLLPTGEKYAFAIPRESVMLQRADGTRLLVEGEGELASAELSVVHSGPGVAAVPVEGEGAYVRGERNAEIARFVFSYVGDGSATLRSLRLQGYRSLQSGGQFVTSAVDESLIAIRVADLLPGVALYDGAGEQIAGRASLQPDGTVLFSGFAREVTASQPLVVVVRGDINPYIDIGASVDALAFDIADGRADVMVTGADGTALSVDSQPNGGASPRQSVQVRQSGSVDLSWEGVAAPGHRGEEVKAGTLTLVASSDSFTLRALSLRDAGSGAVAQYRVDFRDESGTVISQVRRSGGTDIPFPGLSADLPKGQPVTVDVYVIPSGKAGEAVQLTVLPDGVFSFVSKTPQDPKVDPSIAGGTLTITKNTESAIVVEDRAE